METQTELINISRHAEEPELVPAEIAQELISERRREYVAHVAKTALSVPLRASEAVLRGIGHGIRQVAENIEVEMHDRKYGTNFAELRRQKAIDDKNRAMAAKLGFVSADHCRKHP